ncbi:tetratricopeptide repeat protein, partial [Desulfovulcanus sp.]
CLVLTIGIIFWESLLPKQCAALIYYWGKQPQNERIVFKFDRKIPAFKLKRTAKKQIALFLPPDIWKKELKPTPVDLSFSRLVEKIVTSKNGLEIKTKHTSFGFICTKISEELKIVLDIFYDPLGAKWSPPQKTAKKQTDLRRTKKAKYLSQKATAPSQTPKPTPQEQSGNLTKSPALSQPSSNSSSSPRQRSINQKNLSNPTPLKQHERNVSIPHAPQPTKRILPKSSEDINATAIVPKQTEKEPLYKLKARIKKVPPDKPQILRSNTLSDNKIHSPEKISPTQEKPEAGSAHRRSLEKQPKSNPTQPSQQDANTTTDKGQPLPESKASATTNATSSQTSNQNSTQRLPDYQGVLVTVRAAIANGQLDAALESLTPLVKDPRLPEELKEEVLYTYADLLFQKNRNNLEENFSQVVNAFEQAINYNPKSPRLPLALLNLGYVHLQVGNIPEARGYFNLLRKKFPYDHNVPLTYFYWAEYYFRKKNFQKAADGFQYIIQKYPEHRIAKKAAVGLANSLKELEFYKQAGEIVDYIEQRWPRYYIDDPEFLVLSGYVAYKNKKYEHAKDRFWLYVNLLPEGDKVDITLARIGDIYLLKGKKQAAKEIYEQTAKKFPDQEGGLIAAMRLAEEGIYDQPTARDMFSVFDRPYSLRPQKIYTLISDKYPNSPLAPVALLKLAIWELWNKNEAQSLETIKKFFKRYRHPKELRDKAIEVAIQAFEQMAQRCALEGNYKQILNAWTRYPFLSQNSAKIDPETRLALATAFSNNNQISKAIQLAQPILSQKNVNQNSFTALALLLNIYFKMEDWKKIIELGEKCKNWSLPPKQKQQLNYALALAYENLGYVQKSLPLWRKLAADIELPKKQRAYALYFLAQNALSQQDLENVYIFAQEALSIFLEEKDDIPKIKSCLDLLIQATVRTGRKKEALGWALELATYIKEDDPDWPSFKYRLAGLYKLNGDKASWAKILNELINKKPRSLFSKMAKSDLMSAQLLKEAKQYLVE